MFVKIYKLLITAAVTVLSVLLFDEASVFIVVPVSLVCGYLISNVLLWLFILGVATVASKKPEKGRISLFYGSVLNMAYGEVCKFARIKIKVTGKDLIPNRPYLLIANHRSNFDNFILSSIIKNPHLVYISKPQNFNIPFAGRIITRCGYLPIDKDDPRKALKSIHKAADMVKNTGAYVGVFPEGRRVFEGPIIPFSEGCFLVAKKAACPVVVASIKGTEEIKKRFPRKTEVDIDFLTVIDTETVAAKRSGDISDIAFNAINENLTK